MEERKYCVYKHTSPSQKVYIGITKQSASGRWKNGLGYQSSPHFWNAIQKYGWDSFLHEVLSVGLSAEEACEEERRLIAEYMATDRRFGYNEKDGGQKGSSLNDIARKRVSDGLKKFYAEHPEERKAIAERVTGYRHSDEAKAKMREAAKGRHYVLTDEWKQKIGESNRKRILEDKELYAETCSRCKANGEKAAKPVVQLTLSGEIVAKFCNAHEAERETGIRNGNIGSCCRGKARTAGGYKWRYAIEDNNDREVV